jgi:hypothetical protein
VSMETFLERIPKEWGRELRCGPGWHGIILALDSYLSVIVPEYTVHQCEGQSLTLRFYWAWPEDTSEVVKSCADALVRAAEVASAYTCEECGSHEGRLCGTGWVHTLCPKCDGHVIHEDCPCPVCRLAFHDEVPLAD